MKDKSVLLIKRDNSVSIMYLTEEGAKDIELAISKWETQHIGEYLNHKVIDTELVPQDREFRNAWRYCPVKTFSVDLDHAKEIKKADFIAKRDKCLEELKGHLETSEFSEDYALGDVIKNNMKRVYNCIDDAALAKINNVEDLKRFEIGVLNESFDLDRLKKQKSTKKEAAVPKIDDLEMQIKSQKKDMDEALSAIKGFLQEIPAIKDAVNKLQQQTKGKK